MDWFMKLPTEVQLSVLGIIASVVTMIGVMIRDRFAAKNPSKEEEFKRHHQELRFSEDDRQIIIEFRETIEEHGREIGRLREEVRFSGLVGRFQSSDGQRSGE
jgi:hypothetical protein